MDLFTLTLISCALTIFSMGIIIALIVIVLRYGGQGVSSFVSNLLSPLTGGEKREEQQDERVQRERQLGVSSREALRQRARQLDFAPAPGSVEGHQFTAQTAPPQSFGGQPPQFNPQSAGNQQNQFGGQQNQFDPSRFGARLGDNSPPRPTLTPSNNPPYGGQTAQPPQGQSGNMPTLSPSRPYQAGGTGPLPPTSQPPRNPNQFPQQQGYGQQPPPQQGYPQQPPQPRNPNQFPQQQGYGQQQPQQPRNPNQFPQQQPLRPGGFRGNPGQQRPQGQQQPPQPPQQQGDLGAYRPNIRDVSRPSIEGNNNIGGRPRRDQRQGDEFREIYLDDGGFDDFG